MVDRLSCMTNLVGGDTYQNELIARADEEAPHAQSAHSQLNVPSSEIVPNAVDDLSAPQASRTARSPLDLLPFTEIWAVDFEFDAKPGES
jgi:hypothetical protein